MMRSFVMLLTQGGKDGWKVGCILERIEISEEAGLLYFDFVDTGLINGQIVHWGASFPDYSTTWQDIWRDI